MEFKNIREILNIAVKELEDNYKDIPKLALLTNTLECIRLEKIGCKVKFEKIEYDDNNVKALVNDKDFIIPKEYIECEDFDSHNFRNIDEIFKQN